MIPLGLQTALEAGRCVLFVGSGIGQHATRPDGVSAPDAATLATELANHFEITADDPPDLAKIARVVEIRKGRPELQAFLTQRLADLEPDETLRWLFSLRWAAIFTTNYDTTIERAYELTQTPPQTPIVASVSSEIADYDPRFEVPVYHLHGALLRGPDQRVVITESDYANFGERRRMLFEIFKGPLRDESLPLHRVFEPGPELEASPV